MRAQLYDGPADPPADPVQCVKQYSHDQGVGLHHGLEDPVGVCRSPGTCGMLVARRTLPQSRQQVTP